MATEPRTASKSPFSDQCAAFAERAYWFDRLKAEHDNFSSVIAWTHEEGEAETAARLGAEMLREEIEALVMPNRSLESMS